MFHVTYLFRSNCRQIGLMRKFTPISNLHHHFVTALQSLILQLNRNQCFQNWNGDRTGHTFEPWFNWFFFLVVSRVRILDLVYYALSLPTELSSQGRSIGLIILTMVEQDD